MKIKVSFVLICYNEKERVMNCIRSIKSLKTGYSFEILLVDNNSGDGTSEAVRKNFKHVNVIELKKNIGTPAYNEGVKKSRGEYVFFTASDVELKVDMLDPLVEVLDNNKGIAQAAPKYMNFYDRKKIDLAGTWLSRSFYSGTLKDDGLGSKNVEIPYMGTGLVRSSVLKKLGYLFDYDYFIYGEDVDLGLRIRLTGCKIVYVPSSIVYHVGSVSQKIHKQGYLTFLMERNLMMTFLKTLSIGNIILLLPYVVFMRLVAAIRDIITLKFINAAARAKAMLWVLLHFNFIAKKRKATQSLRRVNDKELFRLFSEKYIFG